MNHIKLHRYICYLINFNGDVVKTDRVLANCQSDAIVMCADKYARLIDKQSLNIRTCKLPD